MRRWRAAAGPGADPLLEPATLAAARTLRERFLGTLLGLATGDAVGVATQYGRPGRFTPVGDMLGGGPFDLPRGAWSDDTAMALCWPRVCSRSPGFDARDQVARYRRWQQEGYLSATDQCVGITAATARALAQAQWRRQAFSGSHDPGSAEPEALSRVAPVALFYFADAERSAEESARGRAHHLPGERGAGGLPRTRPGAARGAPRGRQGRDLGRGRLGAAHPGRGPSRPPPQCSRPRCRPLGRRRIFATPCCRRRTWAAPPTSPPASPEPSPGPTTAQGAIPAPWRDSLLKLEALEGFADRLLTHALLSLGS